MENFFLKAIVPSKHVEIIAEAVDGEVPSGDAFKGTRPAFFVQSDEVVDTAIYAYESLRPGNTIMGPAIIEATDTTCVINPGWKFTMDQYRHGILKQTEERPRT